MSGLLEPTVLPERLQMAFSALDKFRFPVLEQLSALFPSSQHFKNGNITKQNSSTSVIVLIQVPV